MVVGDPAVRARVAEVDLRAYRTRVEQPLAAGPLLFATSSRREAGATVASVCRLAPDPECRGPAGYPVYVAGARVTRCVHPRRVGPLNRHRRGSGPLRSVATDGQPFSRTGRAHRPARPGEECALLDDLVAAIRRGESRSLVLRGEAGIGKTALLEYLIASASDLTVVRAVGVESEMELAYAGLHQLCGPLLDRLESLPAPQRQAMEIVFGLSAGGAPDRFLVGLAVLSLFAEAAEQRPLLCVVDDAQWLDQASALTLAFVARRLLAEPVGLVFAAREPGEELRHVPELEVHGVRNGDARALLSSAVRFKLDERVRDRIIAETRGIRWRCWSCREG